MKYTIRPIARVYAVIYAETNHIICICNIKRNAELIADILNSDNDNYEVYPNAKYKIVKAESEG